MSSRTRKRFAIPALLAAAIALVLALPSLASADPLGEITEYSEGVNQESYLGSITAGPDGNLWYTGAGETRTLSRITPSGTVTGEFTLPEGSFPISLAPGPDGNLWFANSFFESVGRTTTSGETTLFPVEGKSTAGMAPGPDGNLWFTTESAIARITPTGTITEFSAGLNAGAVTEGIVAGPDGNLWFSDIGTTKAIGKITTSGTIKEFSAGITSPSYGSQGIVAGSDGNVWFIDEAAKKIGKITPSGTVTEYGEGLPAATSLNALATGPDGNVWFTAVTEFGENMIGRITPTGTISLYTSGLNPNAEPTSIIAGPKGDGNVWFIDAGGGGTKAIGKIGTEPQLELTVAKTGEGTVVSSPAGIECGSECKAEFEKSSTVTLTASPASGYAFNSWAGCTTHVGLTCTVEMSKAKTVKASFIATPSLTIEKAGSGQGKASATGISCDENCSKATSAIKTGTSVTVKVASAKGSEPAVFEGGTGSASGCSGASCTFTISENSSVKVKFDPKPTKTLTVNLTGPAAYKGKVTGKGTIKGLTGSAISCGSGCTTQTESFFQGDTVTLTAVAGTGYTFAGWSGSEAGTCTGTTSPCTISTSANKTLSAEFK